MKGYDIEHRGCHDQHLWRTEKSGSGKKHISSLYYGTETFVYQPYGQKEKSNRKVQVNNLIFRLEYLHLISVQQFKWSPDCLINSFALQVYFLFHVKLDTILTFCACSHEIQCVGNETVPLSHNQPKCDYFMTLLVSNPIL